MKTKLISIIAVLAMGILVLMLTVSNYSAVEREYNANVASARANAENLIPYNAYNYYKAAFEIRCEDEAVYQEYLAQAQLLSKGYYNEAIEDYVVKFPESATAYELLCKMYYDDGSYSQLMDTALEAREKGLATDQVRDWYNECAYMLRYIKADVQEPQPFLGGYALVKMGGAYGYIDENGTFLLAPLYTEASAMMDSYSAVNDGEEWHIINSLGYKVARTTKPVDYMGIMVGGKIPVAVGGKYGYVTTTLEIPETLPYDYASNLKNGVAAVKKGDKWALLHEEKLTVAQNGDLWALTTDEQLLDYAFEDILLDAYDTCCNDGVIFAKTGGKYYMYNAQGEQISQQGFDDAKPFAGDGLAAICISGKWGFVDTTGAIFMEPQYEDANSFSIGIAGVCVDGKWGYINTNGAFRIACQFEECQPFAANGIAAVKEDGMWSYVRLLSYYN